jgi:hypothetical protein
MMHGRDHQEREQKVRARRANHRAERTDFETELLGTGRTRGTPRQHLYGANTERRAPADQLDQGEPTGGGSDVAPTRRAEERERERHRIERKLGRMAAGSDENLRDRREPTVTRRALERAAREADRKVSGSS